MLYASTLSEVTTNVNTGIEYEIAMFYCLLQDHPEEQHQVKLAFSKRADAPKINEIISKTNLLSIMHNRKNETYNFSKRNVHFSRFSHPAKTYFERFLIAV